MGEKLVNSLISAVMGALAAVGTVWFLYEPSADAPSTDSVKSGEHKKFDELEVGKLKVTDSILVHHAESGEPLIELKNGVVLAKKEVLSNYVGGFQMVGQKFQVTTKDPSSPDLPVFCELATNEDGGAYLALLSPQGKHSVNMGFDKNETGFIISQNNEDSSIAAQAILPLPSKTNSGVVDDASTVAPAPVPVSTPAEVAANLPASVPISANAPISETPQPVTLPETDSFPASADDSFPAPASAPFPTDNM